MDLDLLNHRDYQLGGLTVTLIVLFVSLGLNFTTVLILTPLAFGAGYVFWRCKSSKSTYSGRSAGYGRSSDVNSVGNRSYETTKQAGNKQRWTVTIGEEHTPSYIANPTENMDRSGLRGSLLTASIMSPATRSGRSLLGSPVAVSPARQGLSAGPGSTGMPLPRMRRVHDSYNEGSSLLDSPRRGLLSPGLGHTPPSSRRYPTHQPKYAGLGLMPPVHLQGPDRRALSERNTSMLTSPVTVKIAPPDILKPPIPSIVPVEESLDAVNASHLNPCDAQNVLSAIREKRKRTMKDEEVTPVIDSRENKRRRHVHEADPRNRVAGEDPAESEAVPAAEEEEEEEEAAEAGETATITMETTLSRERSLKRPAISRSRAASIAEMEEQMVKRSRSSGPAFSSPTTPGSGSASHGRNPIEVSYSSSKRWLKKQQELGKSEERSAKRRLMRSESWARSARTHDTSSDSVSDSLEVRQSQVSTSRLSPRRILSLVDQDMPMRDDTESHRTPASESLAAAGRVKLDSDDVGAEVVQTPDVDDVRAKLFPVPRDSSSRRRHTQIRSDSNTEAFAKVPTLRYSLTTEDYEKDRVSEMKRVQQMLDDVEEAHAAKAAAKTENKPLDAKDKKTATVSLATSSGLLSSTATKIPPLSTPASFASTSLLGMGASTSTVLSSNTPKLLSAPSSFTLGTLTSSSNSTVSSAASSQSAMSTQSLSAVTSVTSISTPLLQSGAALSTVSSKDLPATTSVVTALQFTTQATTDTPQLPTGGGGPHRLATATSQASATAESKLAATGVETSSASASTDKSATTSSSSSYTFPPLFPGAAPSPGDATATSSAHPPPSYSSIERSTIGGFNFDGAADKAGPAASASVSSTVDTTTLTTAPFTFSVASTTLTSSTNSTTSSMPGFSFTSTAPAAFGATNASAVQSGPTAPTSLSSSFSFGSVLPVSSSQAATSHFNVPRQASSSDFGSTLTSGSASTASVSSVTAFGTSASSAVPAFSSNLNATPRMPFGASAPAIPAPVIATPATSTAFSFGGTAGQTGKIASPFGEQASTMFGQAGASNTTTAAPSGNIFAQQAEAPSIAFGQAPLSTAAPGGKDLFARAPAKTAGSAPSLFGSAAKPANGHAQNSGFQFGVAMPNKTSSCTTSFQFGTSAANTSAPTTVQASPFAFGAQAPGDTNNKPGIMAFGQPTASATPPFGNTTAAPSNVFGSTGPSAPFGRSNASVTFGTATTTNNLSPAFGQPVVQGTQNAFGVDANKGGCAFGSTGPMSQPAFGVSTTNAFGGGQQQSSSGGFGAPAKTQAAKGFDFSASAKPVLNFGGASSAAQTPPQQAGFTFGAANTQQNTGFNFNAGGGGGGGGFGMTAPGTPQMGSQPPAFGTPGANPAGPPNLFSPPGTPGQGAFTIGSGNVQPRPRTVVRAARRRATKR